jgi:Na+-transporting NADH:ubiquinone oxidoreductase subunit B
MKFLRSQLDAIHDKVKPGGPLSKWPLLYTLYDMHDTILFTDGTKTKPGVGPHARDALDSKRLMFSVVIALIPCILFAIYNTGAQALAAEGYNYTLVHAMMRGAWHYLPILAVTFIAGGVWEVLFATVRREEVSEGFLVTGMLIPLIMPPDVPLWQLAVAVSFGIVIGKEVFGGVGMNILNPALTARAFLFFTYPASISGDVLPSGSRVWNGVGNIPSWAEFIPHGHDQVTMDAFSGATPLAVAAAAKGDPVAALEGFATANGAITYDFQSMLFGCIPGSMGETSVVAVGLGAAFLILIGIGSWRIMASAVLGLVATALALNAVGSETNAMFALPWHYHLVMGGFAFGAVFMATDPVSAAATNKGKWIYGFLIGVLVVLVRTVNPAYPEGTMLAILFMNVFAPLIDHFVVRANIKRRSLRMAQAASN